MTTECRALLAFPRVSDDFAASGPLHCQPCSFSRPTRPLHQALLGLFMSPQGPACTLSPSPRPEHPGRQQRSWSQVCGVMAGDNLGVKRKHVLLNPDSACLLLLVRVVGCCLEPRDLGKEKAGKVRVGRGSSLCLLPWNRCANFLEGFAKGPFLGP